MNYVAYVLDKKNTEGCHSKTSNVKRKIFLNIC